MPTFHLHIQGRVQGVGFRPYVFGLAKKLGIKGAISNGKAGVHIRWNADSHKDAEVFKNAIAERPPVRSVIQSISLKEGLTQNFVDFKIIKEDLNSEKATVDLSPDFAMCEACKEEFNDPVNRRFQYPFITCTDCGPRFSIQNLVPYEREYTSMSSFSMCKACLKEYDDPENRRFYSQTNSCKKCGIKITLQQSEDAVEELTEELILEKALMLLKDGKTIAVKGIGGFLLLCDASNQNAIQTLRKRKHRPDKPLAVLFKDVKSARKFTELSKRATEALLSSESPIVVVPRNEKAKNRLALKDINGGFDNLGVMLPYAPILEWIASHFDHPLIATSANLSGDAIIYKEEQIPFLFHFADAVINHNREILNPQDDSVIKFSSNHNRKVILRRSRGLAPAFHSELESKDNAVILATGAMLKSSFAIQHSNKIQISQFQGDTSSADALDKYELSLERSLKTSGVQSNIILADSHPEYPTKQFAQEFASSHNIPLHTIQHHKAHFAAVLGENNLFGSDEPVLGVVWDGTGYGEDNQIWGSEFFSYHKGNIGWLCAFQPFPHIAGDHLAKQPRIAALASTFGNDALFEAASVNFTDIELQTYKTLLSNSALTNRGCGRFFDAMASLLGMNQRQSFEGQAAMLLEQIAKKGKSNSQKTVYKGESFIQLQPLMEQVLEIQKKENIRNAAAFFHQGLVSTIRAVANYYGFKKVALSGGVFQNTVLLDSMGVELENFFHIFTHKQLSPNDESISYGQLMAFQNFND